MIKHFNTRKEAEAELRSFGFKPLGSYWVKPGFSVTIHPLDNSDVVQVFYREVKYA